MSLDNLRAKAERCVTHHYCDCAWYKINKLGVELANAEAKLTAAEKVIAEARSRNAFAVDLIRHAVQIMSPSQVGKWTGVRAWQEDEGLEDALRAYDKSQAEGGDR